MCHRDVRIRLPLADVVAVNADGVRYQRPQYVLLAKAKHRREKDEADLANVAPTLDSDARRWLAAALTVVHPGHPWIERFSDGEGAA